jgi:putative ABC transport system permease protein
VERRQEFALRRALGASRFALVRQVMIEGAIVVALGALVGLGLAWSALHLIPAGAPADLPRVGQLELRPGVILVSIGLALLGVALAGLLPAHSIREAHLALPRGGIAGPPSPAPARSVAVATQVASAIVTVAAALLLVTSLSQLQRLESGFDPAGLTILQVAFLSPRIDTDERAIAAMDEVLARARAVPGVHGAAAVLQPPLYGTGGYDYGFLIEGQTGAQAAANPYLNYEAVTADYFAAFGLPILRGRALNDADRAGSLPVVVVSRGLAARMWPGQDPLGKRLRWAGDTSEVWRTVVGAVNDTRYRELLQLRPTVYVPVHQQPWIPTYLIVRSRLPLDALSRHSGRRCAPSTLISVW